MATLSGPAFSSVEWLTAMHGVVAGRSCRAR
jgi:hypothetical protein